MKLDERETGCTEVGREGGSWKARAEKENAVMADVIFI